MFRSYTQTFIPWLFILYSLTACLIPQRGNWEMGQGEFAYTNRLIEEKSPYLRRSAHAPVDWYPWGTEARTIAETENKLLFINIGREVDHSGHEMDRSIYSDTAVAAVINQYFVPIKVDLEERPDVYRYFLKACQLLNKGECEFPMHLICLPDGSPIFAGGYYDYQTFQEMINGVLGWYETHSQNVITLGKSLKQDLRLMNLIEPSENEEEFSFEDLRNVSEGLYASRSLTPNYAYPASFSINPTLITYQSRYAASRGDTRAIEALENVMKMYIWSANYDHIGGGFFHAGNKKAEPYEVYFNKSLKHNSEMIGLYAELFQLTHDPEFERVVYESIAFVERELTSMEGGMYAAVDAESESVDGKYYTWTIDEINELLRGDARIFADYFNLDPSGNWRPDQNVLFKMRPDYFYAEKYKMDVIGLQSKIDAAKRLCFRAKKSRARPSVDQRRVTAWNAQMVSAYLKAYKSIGEKSWLGKAVEHGNFLWNKCQESEGKLYRIYAEGKVYGEASLEDYTATAHSFFLLYQMTFDEIWLNRASDVIDYLTVYFGDHRTGLFFLMPYEFQGDIIPQVPIRDDHGAAMNAQMCKLLMEIGVLLDRLDYRQRSLQMLKNIKYDLLDHPNYYASWSLALMQIVYPTIEVAIVGENCKNVMNTIAREHFPQVLFLGTENRRSQLRLLDNKLQPGKTLIYVCRDNRYPKPTESLEEAIGFIHRAQGF